MIMDMDQMVHLILHLVLALVGDTLVKIVGVVKPNMKSPKNPHPPMVHPPTMTHMDPMVPPLHQVHHVVVMVEVVAVHMDHMATTHTNMKNQWYR